MAPADAFVADGGFRIELVQQSDYRFEARFDDPGIPVLLTDELKPLGGNAGPSPVRLLGVSVANCLAASLLFAMRKFKNDPGPLRAVATVKMVRNPQNRLRGGRIAVDVHLAADASAIAQIDRVLAQFEDFCVVTQSVRLAFPVDVRVLDKGDTVLHSS
ncbi:MAG: OsmC family protein [Burkholderiales bacterium]